MKYNLACLTSIFLVLLWLPACGKDVSSYFGKIDPLLQLDVKDFINVTEGEGTYSEGWSVSFGVGVGEAAGGCQINVDGFRVVINPDTWGTYDRTHQRTIVFHEMTHCVFNLGHSSDPTNYMYPSVIDITMADLDRQLRVNAGLE